ncbi:hypothetical protein MMC11_001244 [Xylographa trunciseda]|nr:hypothetical protein [Xylographa trunciseda]
MSVHEHDEAGEEKPLPPPRLYERLAHISGYTWDQSLEPFHSSYDNWHVFGTHHTHENCSCHSSNTRPSVGRRTTAPSESVGASDTADGRSQCGDAELPRRVVARISTHALRLEREFQLCKSLVESSDPHYEHTVRPLEFAKLSGQQGEDVLVVSIFESPGSNYLRELVDFGPAFWNHGNQRFARPLISPDDGTENTGNQISLSVFLDFAIGATECLSLLHHGYHGLRVVHGEIRGDAFHFNRETGAVKLINYGSGLRSFENGLTSTGWSSLSREVGIKNKLRFIAPEQTGRMPAEPDSRTDIYSLGILFWTMLAGFPAVDGQTPIDIIQSILGRKIPPLASKRMDVPDALSKIIQKMTQKQIDERYHSTSGLKYDLVALQKILIDGDQEALKAFKIGTKDVSSFFVLPTALFGRENEHAKIVKIIDKVARRQAATPPGVWNSIYNFSTSSSTSNERQDGNDAEDASSDTSSKKRSRSEGGASGGPTFLDNALKLQQDSQDSVDTTTTAETVETLGVQHSFQAPTIPASITRMTNPRRRPSQHTRRKGRTEIITIIGSAGMGKSTLIHAVQGEIRRQGYYANAKYDDARKAPFEPLLKVMSSLFRQIFSESDVNTAYHNMIRMNIKAIWNVLSTILDLPENLIFGGHQQGTRYNRSVMAEMHNTGSSSSSTKSNPSTARAAPIATSLRILSTYIDVLRTLASGKLICLCLDDLQFADEESLELISSIVSGKIRIVLITTCRREEEVPKALKPILDGLEANVTRLKLDPLSEKDVIEYVASTLYRSREYVFPLAAVALEKTNGNPFYLRQMLDLCYRKNCLWFDWQTSAWEFSLDRVFTEFEAEDYGSQLNTSFITRQLKDQLPAAARSILAWASLLGNSFSFNVIQSLMSGKFNFVDEKESPDVQACQAAAELFASNVAESVVEGLQACLQTSILVPCDDEDYFRFGHERYQHAAQALRECQNVEKMHYIIAETLLEMNSLDSQSIYAKARHICYSVNIIRRREMQRYRFRAPLAEAATKAIASGARPTALWYYETCIELMQPNPWEDGVPDVHYDETLEVFTKTAEVTWYQGRPFEALRLLKSTFEHARTAADKAPSWILRSRILTQKGETLAAFDTLKTSLAELGLEFERKTSWEQCDEDYHNLQMQLESMEIVELVEKPLSQDPRIIAMGTVLSEAISAGYWSDSLLFHQMATKLVWVYLNHGTFVQIGAGFLYLAMVAMSRFSDMSFGHKLHTTGIRLLRRFNDPYTLGRGLTLSYLFVSHYLTPIGDHVMDLEEALDYTLASGDKIVSLLTIGCLAGSRLFMGFDMADLESFCGYAAEDYGDWTLDLRGGICLMAVRQVARALQGKTRFGMASTVMSDDNHDSEEYLKSVYTRAFNAVKPRDIYNSFAMIPLYLYGHFDTAISTGRNLLLTAPDMWGIRNTPLTLFYLSLSLLAQFRLTNVSEDLPDILAEVQQYKEKIDSLQTECNVNYLMWSLLIEAETSELCGEHHKSILAYEAAIDHCQVYGFALEEATAFELQAEFYIRIGAKRSAKSALEESLGSYARICATGKMEQLSVKHEWVLKNAAQSRTNDVAVQTANSVGEIRNTSYRIEENERREVRNLGEETADDRTAAWLNPVIKPASGDPDLARLGLDVVDLQSLLEFNQAISSELQIDRLLAKMTGIILESAGAHFAGVVIESEDDGGSWCFAASGTQDGINADALPLNDLEDKTAKQVVFYTLRFKETVFVSNILHDERFSPNALSPKSIISLPILQGDSLLGVLYLEGQAQAITSRHLGVLQLFCGQVAISISNALLFRKLRKVSATNVGMIEAQKKALKAARAAEEKARVAESEALRNVKLKEEAAKAKSMFLANVSHELRTPLNGVIGMSELLKGTHLTGEQEGFADSIRVCADTLLTVINDILDFSKLEAGKMKLFSVPLNLNETITEVVRALSYTNIEKGLETVVQLDLDKHLLVLGDPVRLHQVLMNLLANAYKFTAQGKITVRSETQFEDDRSILVTISVSDTGIGITQEQLSRLFTPFSQADSSTQRSYGGSGLGLSICKALIEVLEGRIWLESQLGVGTTVFFELSFPKLSVLPTSPEELANAKDPDPMATWSSDVQDSPSRPHSAPILNLSHIPRDQLRICIAEDNPINQKIAVSFVTKLGFQCQAFNDGLQAVEALREQSNAGQPFHLVLMDVQMPVLDGYDATRLIRLDPDPAVQGVLVIAMTASAIRGDRERCLEAGMNNYLAKPVRAAVLKDMLEEYLNQNHEAIPDLRDTVNEVAKKAIASVKAEREAGGAKGRKTSGDGKSHTSRQRGSKLSNGPFKSSSSNS